MNKLFKFALAALPIVMLASCAKDDLESGAPKAEKSETRYLKVTLTSPTASPVTRAWSNDNTSGEGGTTVVDGNGYYADGTEEENKIQTLDFYFYTGDKQYHSHVPVTVINSEDKPGPATPTENPRPSTSPNIAAYYHCNVPIELEQGQAIPSYVVCIVNAVEPTQYQELPMKDAQMKELKDLYSAGSTTTGPKYFGMSNSVYYGRDDVSGTSGELIMATPFTTDKLLSKSTLEELEDQATNPQPGENQNEIEKYTINIPVERYAVKVNLDLSPLNDATKIPDYEAVQSVQSTLAEGGETQANAATLKLKFAPTRWGVNGTEQTFYFIKCFRDYIEGTFTPSNDFATEADLNTVLKWDWNNPDHKRCFWSRTPTYYSNQYPITSDDITEPEDNVKYNLKYKSWDECADINEAVGELGKHTEYAMETTMMKNRLNGVGLGDNYLPTASLPSVILLGKYEIEGAPKDADFYLYGKIGASFIIYSGENVNEQIPGTGKILDRMLLDQNIILRKTAEGKYVPVSKIEDIENFAANIRAQFAVEHPEKKVRDYAVNAQAVANGNQTSTLHIAEDIVVLQVASSVNSGVTDENKKLYFYNPKKTEVVEDPVTHETTTITGGYEAISAENYILVNHLLYQNLGGAHFYQDGMAFFSAPIYHWGWHRSTNPNKDLTMDKWSWVDMETGDFGIVRNHEYTMKIASITGLGTGIPDPTSPIVPPADKIDYAVHFHVNIQRWAVLPTQEWNW